MRIKTITVTAGRTFNHPYEQYSNLRPEVTMVADLAWLTARIRRGRPKSCRRSRRDWLKITSKGCSTRSRSCTNFRCGKPKCAGFNASSSGRKTGWKKFGRKIPPCSWPHLHRMSLFRMPKAKLMSSLVVYHSADFDGIFCREIARKFLPADTEFVGWNFGDQPLKPTRAFDQVYIMDLPCDRVLGLPVEHIWPGCSNLIWIDHHKSSIETHPKDIPGYRIDGVAACRLAWQWFTHDIANNVMSDAAYLPEKNEYVNRTVSEPRAVNLAGEYDVFDRRNPSAELFQHGLKSVPLTDKHWDSLLSYDSTTAIHLLTRGEGIKYARDQEYAEVITQQGFDVEFDGIKFLACNSHELDIRSQLFEAGIKPHHEALLGFTYNGKKNEWRVSMYGLPTRPELDLSAIAVKHGGGGHKHACGFQCKRLPFWNLMGV